MPNLCCHCWHPLLNSFLSSACHSPGPDGFQFACDVLLLLPQQFAKLSRRKTANALECCSAAASLAKVCDVGFTLERCSVLSAQPTPHDVCMLLREGTPESCRHKLAGSSAKPPQAPCICRCHTANTSYSEAAVLHQPQTLTVPKP